MYKIVENNQIIDVLGTITYIKYLPKSKKGITVDEDGSAELVMRPCSFAYFESGR